MMVKRRPFLGQPVNTFHEVNILHICSNVLSARCNALRRVLLALQREIKALADICLDGLRQLLRESLCRACFQRCVCNREARIDLPGGLEACERLTLSRAVHAHQRLEEIPISERPGIVAESANCERGNFSRSDPHIFTAES